MYTGELCNQHLQFVRTVYNVTAYKHVSQILNAYPSVVFINCDIYENIILPAINYAPLNVHITLIIH